MQKLTDQTALVSHIASSGVVIDEPRHRIFLFDHGGTAVTGNPLFIYFSCVGHRPERILDTTVDLQRAPESWRARGVFEVLRPERDGEGATLPLAFSNGCISRTKVNELRRPAVFRDGNAAWLLYTTSGEHGLGLAKLRYQIQP